MSMEEEKDFRNPSDDGSSAGGIVRGVLRNLRKLVAAETIGNLPTRSIARSADKLSNLSDITNVVADAHEEVKQGNAPSKTFLSGSAGWLKAAAMGTISFGTYEVLMNRCANGGVEPFLCDKGDTVLPFASSNVALPFSFIAGGIGGIGHGLFSAVWDDTRKRVFSQSPFPKVAIAGTMVSHGIVHCSLFGLYELTKRSCFYSVNMRIGTEDMHHVIGVGSVCIAGIASGVASEWIGSITEPLETRGLQCWHRVRFLLLRRRYSIFKNPRSLAVSSVSSMLGFLVHEYAIDDERRVEGDGALFVGDGGHNG